MADPVKITAATPQGNAFDVTFKRWFQTREFWLGAATVALTLIPTIIQYIGTIGLSPRHLLYAMVALVLVREIIGQILKARSNTIVLGKDDYHAVKAEASAAPDPMEFQPPDRS